VEETQADASAVFDAVTADGQFDCEMLYRIEDDGVQMRLIAVQ
jgi:hypothetical protein